MTTCTRLFCFLFFFFFVGWLCKPLQARDNDNSRRSFPAVRTHTPPRIDGIIDDDVWQKAIPVSDFLMHEPHNDRPASFETVVRVLYDDMALYISAMMVDPDPESILTELGLRDSGDQLNADRFWVDINPFNDGINGFRFQVSASGVQTDINLAAAGNNRFAGFGRRGDRNWDAVWASAASIKQNGWAVEMAIPYSALRFPRGEVHEWGINFWREIRRTRETSSWNFSDRRISDPLASMGVMNGIDGIKPPLRLALFPYVSSYLEKNGGDRGWAGTYNGGMDLKLGVSPAFTLDVTLIPDFGQVQSDALVLNLTPFEVKYDENRQFFTEGTELFARADLFYSRRIGARPKGYHKARQKLHPNEVVTTNPIETRMINASKLSGRTSSGLGIGIFNAMTARSHATLKDTLSGAEREITTQPFTNFNLLVIDQSLRNNSYVSLINTNVLGSEAGFAANVTGTEFRLHNRSNEYRINGSGAVSQLIQRDEDGLTGFKYNISAGKVGGSWRYGLERTVMSDTYDQNDMGFLRRNNQQENTVSFGHNIFVPFWRLLSLSNSISLTNTRLYKPDMFTGLTASYRMTALFDTRFFFSYSFNYEPLGQRDYFEPRAPGRFYETDRAYNMLFMYSTDYRKRVYLDGFLSAQAIFSDYDQKGFGIYLMPTFRASDRFNLSAGINYTEKINDIGYVTQLQPDSVYFGLRQSPTLTNTLRSVYIFTNKLSLDFALRHYWSRAIYDGDYFFLKNDGRLQPIKDDLAIPDINYNAFTIDMKLTWNFAPGSQLTAVWKNIIDNRRNTIPDSYLDNLNHVLQQPQINSFSVKVLYYIDYQSIRRLIG